MQYVFSPNYILYIKNRKCQGVNEKKKASGPSFPRSEHTDKNSGGPAAPGRPAGPNDDRLVVKRRSEEEIVLPGLFPGIGHLDVRIMSGNDDAVDRTTIRLDGTFDIGRSLEFE